MERTWDWKHQWLVNECRSLFKEFQFELCFFFMSEVQARGRDCIQLWRQGQGITSKPQLQVFFFRSDWQDSDALLLQHGFVEEEPLLVANLQ